MTPDQIMAISIGVGLALAQTNTWALLKDGKAYGVRPYLSLWMLVSNATLASQMFMVGLLWAGAVTAAFALHNALTAALIAYFRWRQAQ